MASQSVAFRRCREHDLEPRSHNQLEPAALYDGYRLSAIRRGGLADRVGLKNGDIIHRVAGMEMSSMEGTMAAFTAAQQLDVVPVELTRRGVEMTLQIPMD